MGSAAIAARARNVSPRTVVTSTRSPVCAMRATGLWSRTSGSPSAIIASIRLDVPSRKRKRATLSE